MHYFPVINLPIIIILHAVGLVALGLNLTFRRKPASLGIVTFALGVAYLTTSYMPIEQNQFLHASVPVRLAVAVLAAVSAVATPRDEEWQTLWGIAVYDSLGGVLCGLILKSWNGRVAGY